MNNVQWENFKLLVNEGIHICMSISDFTFLLKNSEEMRKLDFDPCTKRDVLRVGVYGWFKGGTVIVCVSKDTPTGHIKYADPESNPIDSKSSAWSKPIPLMHATSLDDMKRLEGLSAFW